MRKPLIEQSPPAHLRRTFAQQAAALAQEGSAYLTEAMCRRIAEDNERRLGLRIVKAN